MATKKPETKESLQTKIETAKLNLNNPKIAANKGLVATTKKRIAEWEKQLAALGKKAGSAKVEKPAKAAKSAKSEKPKKEKSSAGQEKSTMFMVNYLHHLGKTREQIIEQLDILPKKYSDCVWHYKNTDYKSKIEKYIKENGKL